MGDARDRRSRRTLHACICPTLLPLILAMMLGTTWCFPAAADVVQVGAVQYGSLAWVLDVVRRHRFDEREGVRVEALTLADTRAGTVALEAGSADVAVSDWLWVAARRRAGEAFTWAPYSAAAGALLVPLASPVRVLAGLPGRRLGVAGGPADKSWLLVRAYAQDQGLDLAAATETVFASPPLLEHELLAGRIDALLTYWTFAARLPAAGFRPVLEVDDALAGLGAPRTFPLLGYVFSRSWAEADPGRADGFLRAMRAATALLVASDAEWQEVRPLMQADDDTTFEALRDAFRRGVPGPWDQTQAAAAERLSMRLAALDPGAGDTGALPPGTFWSGSRTR